MGAKKSYLEKLEELAREYEAKVTPEEWVQSRLRWEDWGSLLLELAAFAKREIRRRRWRGQRSGVLPEGYDANSVASEVITSALEGKARLAPGWTRDRLMRELERKVSNEVRRLHKLQEAGRIRSEWEILPADANEQPRSVFEKMEGKVGSWPRNGVDEARFQARDKERKEAELLIAEKLRGEDEAVEKLFGCLRDGVVKRREIAAKLGISVGEVTNCRKRLNRKLEEIGKMEAGCPQWVIEEWKAK
ncbi:MAG TPA: hypothetical protein VN578_14660 [Candidatus Binatia bacterium]|jgi:hypothetical protein|nr:hypothetical protein [Candidatus Binatia bacterium]